MPYAFIGKETSPYCPEETNNEIINVNEQGLIVNQENCHI